MTDDELIALVTGPESQRLERKANLSTSKTAEKVREAICAFANDLPASGLAGVVAIGIDDSGHTIGLDISDEVELKLSQARDDGSITPFPSIEVRRLAIGLDTILVAIVAPSTNPPVSYKGRVWIRTGPPPSHSVQERGATVGRAPPTQQPPLRQSPVALSHR